MSIFSPIPKPNRQNMQKIDDYLALLSQAIHDLNGIKKTLNEANPRPDNFSHLNTQLNEQFKHLEEAKNILQRAKEPTMGQWLGNAEEIRTIQANPEKAQAYEKADQALVVGFDIKSAIKKKVTPATPTPVAPQIFQDPALNQFLKKVESSLQATATQPNLPPNLKMRQDATLQLISDRLTTMKTSPSESTAKELYGYLQALEITTSANSRSGVLKRGGGPQQPTSELGKVLTEFSKFKDNTMLKNAGDNINALMTKTQQKAQEAKVSIGPEKSTPEQRSPRLGR